MLKYFSVKIFCNILNSHAYHSGVFIHFFKRRRKSIKKIKISKEQQKLPKEFTLKNVFILFDFALSTKGRMFELFFKLNVYFL